jgi:ABC-type transporter Mla MlaB component
MSPIRTQIWESPTFTIERIEDKAPRTLIYRIAGAFIANDMYRSLKPVLVLNIFEFTVVPGKEPPALVIFDLTEVPSMDSSGLGLIVTHYISCRNRGIRVIAVGVSPNVLRLFEFTRINSLIPMADTVEQAILSS